MIMKALAIWITAVISIVVIGCKDNDSKSPEESASDKIEGTWIASQVSVDGTDHSADYSSFSITFTETKDGSFIYTVTNGGSAFKDITVDTWHFSDNTFSSIIRSDGIEMDYVREGDFLTLQFTIQDPFAEGGRTQGMFGDFTMKLTKK
jgi:hypothetical protein